MSNEQRISFLFEEPKRSSSNLLAEAQVNNNGYGWKDIAIGIQSGSWAIVLTFGVIAFFSAKYFGKYVTAYIEKQLALIDTLKENQQVLKENQNKQAENIATINATLVHVSQTLEHVASNDQHVGELLSEHKHTIVKLVRAIENNQESIAALVSNKESIEARQIEQLSILKKLDQRLDK